jgi:uncharacterized DUF497 family protein
VLLNGLYERFTRTIPDFELPLLREILGGNRGSRICYLLRDVYMVTIYIHDRLALDSGFDWDDGNARKSVDKHDVSQSEAEQVFFNQPLLVLADEKHSQHERRYHVLGSTDDSRLLHITFTLRSGGMSIRVISARDMHREERAFYEQGQKGS